MQNRDELLSSRRHDQEKTLLKKAHSHTHISSHYLQIENTTLDTPLALKDTIETLTDDHKDNEISVVLVDTRTPVIAKRQIGKIPINHVNMIIKKHLYNPLTTDNLENDDTTFYVPLADTGSGSNNQQILELERIPSNRRNEICKRAGVNHRLKLS